MSWRPVMTLHDGTRIEARLSPSEEEISAESILARYRVATPDGEPLMFGSLDQVTAHLARNHDPASTADGPGPAIPRQRHAVDFLGEDD